MEYSRPHSDTLARLMRWYESRCDGEWEHGYGVQIATLDNPGWRVSIDLSGLKYASRPFKTVEIGTGDDDHAEDGEPLGAWFVCRVMDGRFDAACGPGELDHVLARFLDWIDTLDTGSE